MRRFSAEYLERTRTGMWADSHAAFEGLDLPNRERILDVGCGTGELTGVLRSLASCPVIGCDRDGELLRTVDGSRSVCGDATALPFRRDAVDLVACQALLINLPDPEAAIAEFVRVSRDLVAAVEPDNAAVSVESTVPAEEHLEGRVRAAFLEGIETDVSLGADVATLFEAAGLEVLDRQRYEHERVVEPPYDGDDLQDAKRKATGAWLADERSTMLAGSLSPDDYETLRADWRAMGRSVAEAMAEGRYRRREVVPFHVTVGRVLE